MLFQKDKIFKWEAWQRPVVWTINIMKNGLIISIAFYFEKQY